MYDLASDSSISVFLRARLATSKSDCAEDMAIVKRCRSLMMYVRATVSVEDIVDDIVSLGIDAVPVECLLCRSAVGIRSVSFCVPSKVSSGCAGSVLYTGHISLSAFRRLLAPSSCCLLFHRRDDRCSFTVFRYVPHITWRMFTDHCFHSRLSLHHLYIHP